MDGEEELGDMEKGHMAARFDGQATGDSFTVNSPTRGDGFHTQAEDELDAPASCALRWEHLFEAPIVCLYQKDNRIVAADARGNIWCMFADSGKLEHRMRFMHGKVRSLTIGEGHLYACGANGRIAPWRISDWKKTAEIHCRTPTTIHVVLADGAKLWAGDEDGRLHWIDPTGATADGVTKKNGASTAVTLSSFSIHSECISCLAVAGGGHCPSVGGKSAASRVLFSGCWDGTIAQQELLAVGPPQPMHKQHTNGGAYIADIAVIADGSRFVAAVGDFKLLLFRSADEAPFLEYDCGGFCTQVQLSGRWAYSAVSSDMLDRAELQVWDWLGLHRVILLRQAMQEAADKNSDFVAQQDQELFGENQTLLDRTKLYEARLDDYKNAVALEKRGPVEEEFASRAQADECTVMFSEMNACKTDLDQMQQLLADKRKRKAAPEEIDESQKSVDTVQADVDKREEQLAAGRVKLAELRELLAAAKRALKAIMVAKKQVAVEAEAFRDLQQTKLDEMQALAMVAVGELEKLNMELARIAKLEALARAPMARLPLDHSEMVHCFHLDEMKLTTGGNDMKLRVANLCNLTPQFERTTMDRLSTIIDEWPHVSDVEPRRMSLDLEQGEELVPSTRPSVVSVEAPYGFGASRPMTAASSVTFDDNPMVFEFVGDEAP